MLVFLWLVYFAERWVFVAEQALLSLGRAGTTLVAVHWFLFAELLLLWFEGSRAQAQQLSCTDLVALQRVGSSQIRDRTRVSCIGRWILYH